MAGPDASAAQRRALLAGAAFDVAFALPMLLAPRPAATLLGLDLPADLTWFRLAGVLLLIVSGCYVAASRAGGRAAHEVAVVAGAGRLLGCLVLTAAGLQAREPALLGAGLADGVLGLCHLGLALRDRRA